MHRILFAFAIICCFFFLPSSARAVDVSENSTQLSVGDQLILQELLALDISLDDLGIFGPGKRKLKLVGRRKGKVQDIIKRAENPKVVSILLAIALGPFGAHRLYLGTNFKVPLIYTLTLGGGLGILPAIDLIILIITKEISRFQNNSRVFMWS